MRDLNMLLDDRTAWRLPEVRVCSASFRRSKEMLNGGSPVGEGCGSLWMDLKAEPARRKREGERRAGVGVGAERGCRPWVLACLTAPSCLRSSAPPELLLSEPRGLRLPVPPGSGACPFGGLCRTFLQSFRQEHCSTRFPTSSPHQHLQPRSLFPDMFVI